MPKETTPSVAEQAAINSNQEHRMHTIAEDFEHFLAYTSNVPADERLRLAYEHGDYRGRGKPMHKSDCALHCSDDPKPCDCEAGS